MANRHNRTARPTAEDKPPRQSRKANRAPRKPPRQSRKANRAPSQIAAPEPQNRAQTEDKPPHPNFAFRIPRRSPARTNACAGAKTGQTQTFRRPASRHPVKGKKTRRAGATLRMEALARMGALPRGRQFAIRLFEQKPSRETEHSESRDGCYFTFYST